MGVERPEINQQASIPADKVDAFVAAAEANAKVSKVIREEHCIHIEMAK